MLDSVMVMTDVRLSDVMMISALMHMSFVCCHMCPAVTKAQLLHKEAFVDVTVPFVPPASRCVFSHQLQTRCRYVQTVSGSSKSYQARDYTAARHIQKI